MKINYSTTLLSFFVLIACYLEAKQEVINYHVSRSDYTFSSVFDMKGQHKHQSLGSVVKSAFHVKTHYDAYDHQGKYEGQGICRLACLGLIYSWGAEIDVYDAQGNKIGLIDGQVMSSEPAKFSFYDENGSRIAIAYLDQNCAGFSLIDPQNSAFILARLERNFVKDTIDSWDVNLYYPEHVSNHLVKIFAAFVCDTQDKFKPDL